MVHFMEELAETFRARGWRDELEAFYRQRKTVVFLVALMVAMSAFWTNSWAWVGFFILLALYAAVSSVRVGFVVGLSFAAWFVVGIERWLDPRALLYRAIGLWCIATLFLLVVSKADGQRRRCAQEMSDQHSRL